MWYKNTGPSGDIVLSSRIRLARNFQGISFGEKMSAEDKQFIETQTKAALDLKFIDLGVMSQIEKTALCEAHLISPEVASSSSHGSIFVNDDCSLCIMLGEEDHIRIQSFVSGFDLDKALEIANKVDDRLEEKIDFAYDSQFGYLTACPTNTGTGLRASVMVHLPALTHSGAINSIIRNLSKLGLCVRGIYGEGSEALGEIYQISNQVTLGVSEDETCEKLKQIINELIIKEKSASDELYKLSKFELEDKIMRAKGTLQNARIMTSSEAINLISLVRWGINLGIIKDISPRQLLDAFYESQPATLTKTYNLTTPLERDLKRSEVIRSILSGEK